MKVANATAGTIDYRLNIIGVRVWEDACQLISKDANGSWSTLGPRWDLPVHVPRNNQELKAASADTLRLTAYQYVTEKPGSDLVEVLARTVDFQTALNTSAEPKKRAEPAG